MKNLQEPQGSEYLNYKDQCIYPDVNLFIWFKPPNINLFDGVGDPHTHLRAYCDILVGIGKSENLMIKLFVRSLSDEDLTWYTK